MWKSISEAIQAILIILTAMVGSFVLVNTWIKNQGINRKQLKELQETVKDVISDVHELKGADKRQDVKIEKIEERLNSVFDFLIGKKK